MSAPELHRPVDVAAVAESGRAVDFEATAGECAAVAERLGLLGLREFRVRGRLDVLRRGRTARFEARLTAVVTQSCIVTLDPVESAVDTEISVLLVSPEEAGKREELDLDVEEEDVEVVEGGIADLGDTAVQYLALALDPYPRAPGVAEVAIIEDDEPATTSNPFAVLKKLKDKA